MSYDSISTTYALFKTAIYFCVKNRMDNSWISMPFRYTLKCFVFLMMVFFEISNAAWKLAKNEVPDLGGVSLAWKPRTIDNLHLIPESEAVLFCFSEFVFCSKKNRPLIGIRSSKYLSQPTGCTIFKSKEFEIHLSTTNHLSISRGTD